MLFSSLRADNDRRQLSPVGNRYCVGTVSVGHTRDPSFVVNGANGAS
jgi:hypothetical protein